MKNNSLEQSKNKVNTPNSNYPNKNISEEIAELIQLNYIEDSNESVGINKDRIKKFEDSYRKIILERGLDTYLLSLFRYILNVFGLSNVQKSPEELFSMLSEDDKYKLIDMLILMPNYLNKKIISYFVYSGDHFTIKIILNNLDFINYLKKENKRLLDIYVKTLLSSIPLVDSINNKEDQTRFFEKNLKVKEDFSKNMQLFVYNNLYKENKSYYKKIKKLWFDKLEVSDDKLYLLNNLFKILVHFSEEEKHDLIQIYSINELRDFFCLLGNKCGDDEDCIFKIRYIMKLYNTDIQKTDILYFLFKLLLMINNKKNDCGDFVNLFRRILKNNLDNNLLKGEININSLPEDKKNNVFYVFSELNNVANIYKLNEFDEGDELKQRFSKIITILTRKGIDLQLLTMFLDNFSKINDSDKKFHMTSNIRSVIRNCNNCDDKELNNKLKSVIKTYRS